MIATVTELILSVAGAIVDWCYKRNGGRKSSRRDKLMFLVALCLVAVFCAALYALRASGEMLGHTVVPIVLILFATWELGRWRMRRKYSLPRIGVTG